MFKKKEKENQMSKFGDFFVGTKVKVIDAISPELLGRTGEVVAVDHDEVNVIVYIECEEDEMIEGEWDFAPEQLEILDK
jgi:RNase P/RNase MRP subunit p29